MTRLLKAMRGFVKSVLVILVLMVCILFANTFVIEKNELSAANSDPLILSDDEMPPTFTESADSADNYLVQVVLNAPENTIVASTIDGTITDLPFENGDKFKKDDVLVKFDCRLNEAKAKELEAKLRASDRRLEAYNRLNETNSVSEIDFIVVQEENKQLRAQLDQAETMVDYCTITAPYDGRIADLSVNNYELVKSGRVLMKIRSEKNLQAELLVPSIWLQWINIGYPITIIIHESGQTYEAKIVRINGEVDPVNQTAYVVAELDGYHEELLPGMSGRATFDKNLKSNYSGFIGLKIQDQ